MLNVHEPISGRYRLQQCLHQGSMSDVYLAFDERLQQEVAIKLVSNEQPEATQRLQHEIHTLRTLSHKHIVPLLDHGEYEGYHYLVMPYLKQGTLRNRLARGRLTQEEAGHILVQVTSALYYAHQQGIVHRDLKPSNMLLDGTLHPHVYLADFNLAKAVGKGSDITQTGIVIGTPAYMAPELIEKPESVSSDIYALGVLLYHMLTGRVPFSGSSPLAVLWKHAHVLPVPPSSLHPAISAPVEQVILRALQKDPQQRFPSAEALAQAYLHALRSSQTSAVVLPAVQTLEPTVTYRAYKKSDHLLLPAFVQHRSPLSWWPNPHHDVQKALVGLALVALLMIPLSLGFFLSRALAPLPLADKAAIAGVLQQASQASTPQTVPAVHPPGGNTHPPYITPFPLKDSTPRSPLNEQNNPHQRNGHGHGHGNGNQNSKGHGNGHGHGHGNGNGHGHG
ncbi:MAG: serine/threonine-protein kinase [Ktedonobacteraceae bacterium]